VKEYGLFPFTELEDKAAKKERKKKESLVKYKSADILCGAA